MARTRSIKPEFWFDEKIGSLSLLERLLFIGMWTFADDEGLVRANPLYLRSIIFPYDNLKESEIKNALDNLSKNELIFLYNQNNQKYAWIIKFRVYQRIDKPQKPTNPPPSIQNQSYAMAIFKRDKFICHLCHCETDKTDRINITGSRMPSIDHINPQSNGGSSYPTNLATSCLSCNKSRGNKTLEEFFNSHGKFLEQSENALGTVTDETETETETEEKQKQNNNIDFEFKKFWESYPNKKEKNHCLKVWNKLHKEKKLPAIETILQALENQKKHRENLVAQSLFCPDWKNPATWLNKGCWDDECKIEVIDEVEAWTRRYSTS